MTEYAHAIGRARQGDVVGARAAMARMRQLREATTDIRFAYFQQHLDQQLRAVAAWVAAAEGKPDEALAGLRSAAEAEDLLGKNPVSPGALVPVREQLGDLLLQFERPKESGPVSGAVWCRARGRAQRRRRPGARLLYGARAADAEGGRLPSGIETCP